MLLSEQTAHYWKVGSFRILLGSRDPTQNTVFRDLPHPELVLSKWQQGPTPSQEWVSGRPLVWVTTDSMVLLLLGRGDSHTDLESEGTSSSAPTLVGRDPFFTRRLKAPSHFHWVMEWVAMKWWLWSSRGPESIRWEIGCRAFQGTGLSKRKQNPQTTNIFRLHWVSAQTKTRPSAVM